MIKDDKVSAFPVNGWYYEYWDGDWCYFENGTRLRNCWVKDSTGWCFLDNISGAMIKEGWAHDNNGWCYIQDGHWIQHSMWAKDANGWVHISDNGYWDGKPAVAVIPSSNNNSINNDTIQWFSYNDDKFGYTISYPNNIGVVNKDLENNSLSIELKNYNAGLSVRAFKLSTLGMSRDAYITSRVNVAACQLEGKVNIYGADEAYLIDERSLDYQGKTVIAFKAENVYILSYGVSGDFDYDNGDYHNEENDQYIINILEQYFDKMKGSINITYKAARTDNEYTEEMAIELARKCDPNFQDAEAEVWSSEYVNNKKYYWVHFYSQAARDNGGSGTIGNVQIAEDGSILNP